MISLDEYKSIGTHWIALYVNGNNVYAIYFDSFRDEYIPKKKKSYSKQKYNNKYLQNTSMGFGNVSILWYWI